MQYKAVTSRLSDLRAAWAAVKAAEAEFAAVADKGADERDAAWQKLLLAEVDYEAIYGAGR